VEFVFSLPVVGLFALCYLKAPTWQTVLYLPLAMVMCFFLVLGFGLLLAPLAVLIRDVERIVPIFLRVMFYGSPVLYSAKDVPNHLHLFLSINPTTGMLVLVRGCFFPQELVGTVQKTDGHRHPVFRHVIENGERVKVPVMHHVNNWGFVWHSAIGIAIILAAGIWVFARLERPVLKEI
jgi:ABC-2 type transport system permease protein